MCIETLDLLPNDEVFVAYNWDWLEANIESEDDTATAEVDVDEEDENDPDEDHDQDADKDGSSDSIFENSFITHTVTFKCIGANLENSRQVALEAAFEAQNKGNEVPVRLYPEHDNPKDATAIAFQCCVSDEWKRVGYIVKEALPEVHDALKNDNIISVNFAWIKFLLCWSHSGPGFYAGVNISKHGEWSNNIVRCSSTE